MTAEVAHHPVTLGFNDPNVERDWAAQRALAHKRQIQGAALALPVIYGSFGIVDVLSFPDAAMEMLQVRLGLVVPLLLLPLPVLFGKSADAFLQTRSQAMLAYLSSVAVGGLAVMGTWVVRDADDSTLLVSTLASLFATTCLFSMSTLRFVIAGPLGIAGMIAHFVLMATRSQVSPAFLATAAAFGAVGTGIGVFISWSLELQDRRGFLHRLQLQQERARADRLLANLMPPRLAEQLKVRPGTTVDRFDAATVMFATLVHVDGQLLTHDPKLLNAWVAHVDTLSERHGVERIKTFGSTYMAVAGLESAHNHPESSAHRVAALALDLLAHPFGATTSDRPAGSASSSWALRVGIASGPLVAGVIGQSRLAFDCWGDTPNTAARLDANGQPNRIHISAETRRLVKDRFHTTERGVVFLKGKGSVVTYWLEGAP